MEIMQTKISANYTTDDCCIYKVNGSWEMSDTYDWHPGEVADVLGLDIKDDWALLVEKYRKELAVWMGKPNSDPAHQFKEKGTWNGEVTVDCCKETKEKNKGG